MTAPDAPALPALQVLVVDDELFLAEELALGLEEAGMRVRIASSAATAEATLDETPDIGVVITDIRMPGEDGLTLVRRLLTDRPEAKAVETIVMTGHATLEDATAAVRAGAFDFVRKPFSLEEMIAVAEAALARAAAKRAEAERRRSEAARLRAAEAEREALRTRDPVTGLPNRIGFAELLCGLEQAGTPTLAMLDIHAFGALQAALGPDWTNRLLAAIAERLRGAAGGVWRLARLGDGEFAAAAQGWPDADQALAATQGLRAALDPAFDAIRPGLVVTVSAGVAHGATGLGGAGGIEEAATAALDAARRGGGGRTVLFTPDLQDALARRHAIALGLAGGLIRGEFALHYQPIIRVLDGTLTGFEALLRWTHPTLGAVSPAEFIPIAEESRAILDLGAWALREAARQAARWQAMVTRGLSISVNVSGRQIEETDVPAQFAEALRQHRLPASALVAEVTESVATGPRAPGAVSALRALGVRVALDDFGSGYSSLGVLQQLIVHTVKLDRSLLASLNGSLQQARFFAGLVGTIQALGLRTVVEGIETEEQRRAVALAGCDMAQGYLFGRPVVAEQAERLLDPNRLPA